MLNATVSGSFHRHMDAITSAVHELASRNVRVLSPADPRIVAYQGEFLFVASDPIRSVRLVQDRHLECIKAANFLWLVCPDGYVGQSASMQERTDRLEPDSQPIEKDQARSAILFGPPGTSKTTLIRSLADIIGWDYVEIHASHFVAEGLAQVQKTADTIFRQLLELDHVVVLFDEIDELVRERDVEKDAFGRFLTTSMLPKLAELWEARKILYFVATNHINFFDSAIIRSHRFDSLMLVSPPSCAAKIKELTKLLSKTHGLPKLQLRIEENQVQKALEQVETNQETLRKSESNEPEETRIARYREQKLDKDLTLAKFALLRHDELDELAYHLASILKNGSQIPSEVSSEVIIAALTEVDDSEWRKNKSYLDYLRDTRSERRDYQMLNVWEALVSEKISAPEIRESNGLTWLAKTADSPQDVKIAGFQIGIPLHGRVQVMPEAAK